MSQLTGAEVENSSSSSDSLRGRLEALRAQIDEVLSESAGSRDPTALTSTTASQIRRILKARSSREAFFGQDLFADPAWDMLLDLYAAHISLEKVSITSLCLAGGVPTTTALRWIKALETRGLVRRRQDPSDGRRVYVFLTREALAAMESYFKYIDELPI